MTDLLLKLAILVWPFGHLLDIFPFRLSFSLSLLDILASAILLLSIPRLFAQKKKVAQYPLFTPIMIFLCIAILSLLVRLPFQEPTQTIRPFLYLGRLLVYFSLYFSLKLSSFKKYSEYFQVSILVFVLLGLLQYLFFPDVSSLKYLGFDDHYYRLTVPLLDPNFTGAILSSVSLLLFAKNKFKSGSLLLIPLALTFSRASYISFLIPLLILAISRRKYIFLFLPLIPVIALMLSPKPFGEGVNLLRTFSIFSRIGSAQEGIRLFLQRPVLGWGFNTLLSDTGRVGIDNSFIFLLATTGIVGFSSFIYFLYRALLYLAFPERLAITSLLIHALFNNTLFLPWIMAYFIFLLVRGERSR